MRRIVLLLGVFGAVVLGTGCSFAMRPVEFSATRPDWEMLAGDWRGNYTIAGHDRHGLIAFRLDAETQKAAGDVLMIAERFGWPITGMPSRDGALSPPLNESQRLTIRFVAAERGAIRGNMEPYWDPDRACRAWASFLGSVDGDVIAGSFISVCDDGVRVLRGRWRVERRRTDSIRSRETMAAS